MEKVSASTQNQAFRARLLLLREVLSTVLEEMALTVRAKRGRRLPTVLSVAEVVEGADAGPQVSVGLHAVVAVFAPGPPSAAKDQKSGVRRQNPEDRNRRTRRSYWAQRNPM